MMCYGDALDDTGGAAMFTSTLFGVGAWLCGLFIEVSLRICDGMTSTTRITRLACNISDGQASYRPRTTFLIEKTSWHAVRLVEGLDAGCNSIFHIVASDYAVMSQRIEHAH
jgi:hypothetical protein